MKNRLSILMRCSLILSVLLFGTTAAVMPAENMTLALVTKIIEEVMRKSAAADWTKAVRGDVLIAGDQVKTGKNALAVIKFADNSIMRMRELSELTMMAEGPRGSMIKTLELRNGTMGFEVRKQQNEQFHLTSPTSVASIRGTKGKWSGGQGFDTLVVVEGLVNLKNLKSSNDLDIPNGFIGFSNQDGSLTSRKATDQELADANNAANGSTGNELKLELKDSKGNRKELKLRYQR